MYNVGAQAAPSDFRQAARNTHRQAAPGKGVTVGMAEKCKQIACQSRRRTLYVVALSFYGI